ncbi:MAG: HAMP domain-containing histidine kinase, partial [Pseudomonadales bacterium]|nr:HAMP domain-containing histidine kinase [Pseudomonadales bacterium]
DYSQAKKARIEFSSELPAGSVRCNADLLISVFGNLLDNAVEACTQSGIYPSLVVRYQIKAGSLIEIQIADNGPGVSEGSTQQLVEPFFTTKSTGTGLGLAVVKTVIEAHGGRFSISNGAAGGAIATIALPLKEQKQRHSAEV